MPDYNLGTARGRIKIDADDRGARLADRALQAFERTIRGLSGRLGGFEATMNRMEAELKNAERDFNQADRAAGKFDRTVGSLDYSIKRARKSTRDWSLDLVDLSQRMRGFYTTAERTIPPTLQLIRVIKQFRDTRGGIVGLTQALVRAGATGAIIHSLTSKFIGMGAALATVTGHQQKIVRFASTMRLFTLGATALGAFASKGDLAGKALERIGLHSEGAGLAITTLQRRIRNFVSDMDRTAKGAVQFVGGLALMRNNLRTLIGRFSGLGGMLRGMPGWMKGAIGVTLVFAQALKQILAKALVVVSNFLLDVANAAKQLAGGLLVIPGAVAMAVTAFGVLKAIISPMKKQFKDLIKAVSEGDVAKIGEAWDALPPHLNALGRVIIDVLPKWKALQTALQTTFIGGLDQQLRALSDTYLPAISNGSLQVANSWRIAKDQLVAFLSQKQTVSDVQRIFMDTSQTMNNLSTAIRPALEGLRDIAVVGADFLRILSAGLPNITARFAEWARVNRENGNLMRWMTDAWRGTKDLVNGLKDAATAAWTLLTLFANRSGGDALKRFADSMERFNNTVERSAAGGTLKKIGDVVRSMGTDKIKELWEVLKILGGVLKDILPFINEISKGFRDVMIPAIRAAAEIVKQIVDVFNSFGGGQIIGVILGLVGAFGLLKVILGPIKNLILAFFGAFTAYKGAQNIILGVAGTFEQFGPKGRIASNAILSVGDTISKWATRATIAILAVMVVWEAYSANSRQVEAFHKAVEVTADHTKESLANLKKAFLDDSGIAGKNVFSTLQSSLTTLMNDMQSQVDAAPSGLGKAWGRIVESFKHPFDITKGAQHVTGEGESEAKRVQAAISSLNKVMQENGLIVDDVTKIVEGSDQAYTDFINKLKATGNGGQTAANALQPYRDRVVQLKKDMDAAGPGAILLAKGIQQIATAGGDADAKLSGLKLALQGLGLDKTTQYENAIALAEAVNKIATEAANAADASQPLSDLWGANGELNVGFSANARNLFNLLSPAMEQFKRTAASGGDVAASFKRITDQIPALAAAFTPVGGNVEDTTQKITNLITQLGGIPELVKILVQLDGKDDVTQGVAQIYMFATQNLGKGINIPILLQNPKAVEAEIEKTYGDIFDSNNNAIKFKANVDPAAIASLQTWLSQHGIQVEGGPPPANPAQMPIQPVPAPGAADAFIGPAGTRAPAPAAPAPAPAAPITPLPATPVTPTPAAVPVAPIKVDTSGLDTAKGKIDEFVAGSQGKLDGFIAYVKTLFEQFSKAVIDEMNKLPPAMDKAIADMKSSIDKQVPGFTASGQSLMQAFGAGILAGMHGPGSPAEAVETVLREIKARFPSSPPKKGPLAGSNYVDKSGLTLAQDFAGGIISGYPVAGKAADGLASAVGAKLPYSSGSFQSQTAGFLAQFSAILQFSQHFVDAMKQITDVIFSAAKFICVRIGKGTLFGKSKEGAFGFQRDKSITDEELQKRRQDKAKQDIGTEHGKGGEPGPFLGSDATKQQIAAAIASEAKRRGYDRNTAIAAVAAALLESGLNPNVTNASGHESLFQTSADKKVGKVPADQIKWFFDTMDSLGGAGAVGKDPLNFIADKIEKGGYGGSALASFATEAAKLVDSMNSNTVAQKDNTQTTQQATGPLKPTGKGPDENMLRQWVQENFGIPNTFGTGSWENASHPKDGGFHDTGQAFDFHGTKEQMAKLANYIADNFASQTLELIYQGKGFDPAKLLKNGKFGDVYGPAVLGGHGDHVHWATDVAPYLAGPIGDAVTQGADPQQQAILDELRKNNVGLDEAIKAGQNPNSNDQQVADSLATIQSLIDSQGQDNSEKGKQQVAALESVKSSIMDQGGFTTGENPIDQISGIASGAMNVASDVIGVLQSSIEAWAAAKNLADMAIRYPANTEDIMTMIDDFQKFIDLAAKIAQTVGDITSMGAGADPSGITSAISAIAGMIAGALQAVNAVIDLAQEAYHIWGSYFGEFLGILAGGLGGALQGDVRFLLDQNTGQLLAYGQDNPQDKRGHDVPGMVHQPEYQQARNNINVYGGPGSDPRDNTRQMMFQVKAAEMAGATGQ